MKTKIILVAGGGGFIGGHLCRYLLASGAHIICLDNFSTGRKENVADLAENKNFELVVEDILNPLSFDKKIDFIYNLACPASPVHYQANPIKTIKINTIGAMNLLDLAEKHEARILQASTSEIYGDPLLHPQKESYKGNVSTTGPRACYDEGKRLAETLFFDYQRRHGIEVRVARIFNTYGPGMAPNDGRVISNFIIQALGGWDLTIYGNGGQTRSFCYISDLVRGLCALMEKEDFTGPVNLGNPAEKTILEIAEKIIQMTGSASRIILKPLPEDDPRKRKPDISLAKQFLGWGPSVSLDDGLKETIAYFRKLTK